MKNHYQTLGIDRVATNDEIKQAYRKLALKFHPDKNDGDKFFEERFRQIQEAYEILNAPYEKGRYDNEFDTFFFGRQSHAYTQNAYQQKKEEPKVDPEVERRKKEEKERIEKAETEKKRVREIKRNAELAFEDKAWIAIGSGVTVGILGVIMFFKYLAEGYNKKSQQVCVLAIVGFVVLIILSILMQLGKSSNGY